MKKPTRPGVISPEDIHLPSSGMLLGDCRLVAKRDANGNIDLWWRRADGTEANVTDVASMGGAPSDGTYLVTTGHADLSDEIVVGATPGGELGGSWASPTVDDGADSTAIHDNVANEITALVQVTPAAADEFVVEDNSDGYNKKAVLFSTLEGALTHDSLIAGTIADHDTSATGAELDTLTDGSDADALHDHTNHGVTHNAVHGISKHTEHANWKVFHSDGSGDEQEVAVGADGTVFTGTAVDGAPEFGAADDHAHTSQGTITTVGALASGSLAAGFTDVPVAQGGTGASTLADHGVLLGSGAAAVTVVSPVAGPSATAGFQYLRSPDAATDAAYKEVMRTVSITVEDPTASEDIAVIFFYQAVTIREVQAVVVGTSCTIDPYHNTDRSAGGGATDVLDAATLINNTTTGQNLTAFTDATIPADSWLVLETTTSTSCTELTVTFRYTID